MAWLMAGTLPLSCGAKTKLEQLQAVCKVYDYGLDYMPPDGEGGGGEFELWSNTHAPGVTGVYETLAQAAVDVAEIVAGGTPL